MCVHAQYHGFVLFCSVLETAISLTIHILRLMDQMLLELEKSKNDLQMRGTDVHRCFQRSHSHLEAQLRSTGLWYDKY